MKKIFFLCIFLSFSLHSNIFSQPKWERMIFLEDAGANWRVDLLTNNGKDIVLAGNFHFQGTFVVTSPDSGKSWYYKLRDKQGKRFDGTTYIPFEAYSIAYPDSTLCLVALDSGYFWRSTDNCETWEITKNLDVYKTNIIRFWDNKNGVLVATSLDKIYECYKTVDGGLTWEKFNFPESDTVESKIMGRFDLIDTSTIVMLTDAENQLLPRRVKITKDFGKNVEYYNLPTKWVYKLDFINDNVGFYYGGYQDEFSSYHNKEIFRTKNGGKTWYKVLSDSEKIMSYIFDIHFCDSLNGIASGMTKIFRTTDGGEEWFVDTCFKYSEFQHYLGYVALLNPNVAIAVDNAIYRIDYSKTGSGVNITNKENKYANNRIVSTDFINIDDIFDYKFSEPVYYTIYNYYGELIQTELSTSKKIDFKDLLNGVYFISISDSFNNYILKINLIK